MTEMALPQPPYAVDTRAKGWRFELDYEQIEQSDTWDIAAEIPMAQHALLMMWLVAWRQDPCGSLPNDEAIIRAKCKLPPKAWALYRDVLMRGWWLACDGRLYHDTIAVRVLSMTSKRLDDAGRAAARRARKADTLANPASSAPDADAVHGGVTQESRVTPPELTREFDTKHQAPEPEKEKDPPAARVPPWSPPDWIPLTEWSAFVSMRKAKGKRAPFTAEARDGIVAVLAKLDSAGHDVAAALQESVNNGWSGVFAPDGMSSGKSSPPNELTEMFRRGAQ